MFLKASSHFWMYQIFIVLGKTSFACVHDCHPFAAKYLGCRMIHGVHISINIWKSIINFWYTLTLRKSAHQDDSNQKETYTLACTFECKNTRSTSNRKPKSSYGDIIHPLFVCHPLENTKETAHCVPMMRPSNRIKVRAAGVLTHIWTTKNIWVRNFLSLWMKNRPFNFQLRKKKLF